MTLRLSFMFWDFYPRFE